MRPSVVRDKSFAFAVRIVRLHKWLCRAHREFVLSRQLLRSGTSIGACIQEAEYAESRADFAHKLAIALKEANETAYWLRLLHATGMLTDKGFVSLARDVDELNRLLTSIIKSARANAGLPVGRRACRPTRKER